MLHHGAHVGWSQEVFCTCAEPPGEGSGQCRDRRQQLLEPSQIHHRLRQGQRAAGTEQHSLGSPFGFRPLSCGGSKPSAALLPVAWGSSGIKTPLEWLLSCVTCCACTQPPLTQSVTGRSQRASPRSIEASREVRRGGSLLMGK